MSETKPLPKVLVLVLACDIDSTFCAFQILWRQYMNRHPNIKCFFYKSHPNLQQNYVLSDSNTLLIKGEETLDSVWSKTLKAFEYFAPQLDQYDFVFRTTLSSFLLWDVFLEAIRDLPQMGLCAARVGQYKQTATPFPSGAGFLLSTDLVRRLVEEKPEKVDQDDVTIGHALKRWGIPIQPLYREDVVSLNNVQLRVRVKGTDEKDVFHWRMKNMRKDRRRDIEFYAKMLDKCYINPPKIEEPST